MIVQFEYDEDLVCEHCGTNDRVHHKQLYPL